MTGKPINLDIHVCFDSSFAYSGSAHHLLGSRLSALIREWSKNKDLAVHWDLSSIVKDERRSQMILAARDLIAPLSKVEKLLGTAMAVSEVVLTTAFDKALNQI